MPHPRTPSPTAAAAKAATPPAVKPPEPPSAPARVRRPARLQIPPTIRPPTPATAKLSRPPAKVSPKGKPSPAPTPVTRPKAKAGKPKAPRGLSALDAAAMVLEGLKGPEAREGIQANDLIDRMQRAGLWTSPGGKTPAATLYSAMIREIKVKKGESRFTRLSPGHFAFKAAGKARRSGVAE